MKIKRIICILLTIFTAFAALSCNDEAKSGEGEAYGSTTNACPVHVTVKADGDGKVGEIKIEEYLSIYDIGKLTESGGKQYKYGVEIPDSVNGYAKFVRIGDKTFVYDVSEYKCNDILAVDKCYDAYMNGDGGKWYISRMKEGDFDIVDARNESYNVPFTEYDDHKLSKKEWADKMKNGYHEGVEYDNGWKEEIYELITHVKNHGVYDYTGKEEPAGKEKTYKVGKYDTLVSLENFHDYMKLIKEAYEEARKNVK